MGNDDTNDLLLALFLMAVSMERRVSKRSASRNPEFASPTTRQASCGEQEAARDRCTPRLSAKTSRRILLTLLVLLIASLCWLIHQAITM
jgi:hypothetical protein